MKVCVVERIVSVYPVSRSGSGYFGVTLLDSAGKTVDLLANETTAAFTSAHATRIPTTGAHVLQVDAQGAWTITVEQPRPLAPRACPRSLSPATGQT
jgi:hypothetical protein